MVPLKQLPLVACLLMTAITAKAYTPQTSAVSGSQMKSVVSAVSSASHFKSYREWKHEMVQEAQSKVSTLKTQIENRKQARKVAPGIDPNMAKVRGLEAVASRDLALDKLEKDLDENQYDLDIAKDLTVTDYFVGYLTKVQNKKAAFHEVAGKLSPDEVAELMTAYANSVFGAHAADLPTSATNVAKDPVK